MVGISGQSTKPAGESESFRESLETMVHTDRYESSVVLDVSEYSLGTTAYPEYPVSEYEDETYWVYLEGEIYDGTERAMQSLDIADVDSDGKQTNEDQRLLTLAEMVFEGDDTASIEQWITETDGEFLFVAYEKETGRLALLNDALGRLPTYYAHDGEQFLFSRELRYLVTELDPTFDRMGIAQSLLFGYSLGERTLLEGVNRMRPATLLVFDPNHGLTTQRTLRTYSFDEAEHADRSPERNAEELVTLFQRACQRRTRTDGTDAVSLSGGLDSRSVLAGYEKVSETPVAATMESPEYVPESDVEVARSLASEFDIEWDTYQISRPLGEDLETLVKTKNGQIGLVTSFILDFFRQLQTEYGPTLTYLTGDGGDKVLPDLTPARELTENELVDYVIQQNSICPIEDVAEITDLPESAIRESVRAQLEGYPETDSGAMYTHYLVYERGVNYLFEGEDRNRFFFWSTTPFYSIPFFTYAMNCPSEQKARYKLYRTFLEELSPKVARIRHPDYHAPVSSSRHAMMAIVDDFLSRYPGVMSSLKPIIRSVNDLDTDATLQPDTIECIRAQVDQCEVVSDVLSTEDIHRFLDSHADHERISVYRIFALTSFIDDISSNQPVLEAHRNNTFV